MFKVKCAGALSVVLALCFGNTAMADRLPAGASAPSAAQVSAAYAGKTDVWNENCGGGIYFSPNGVATAWCAENSDNFGSGDWTIRSDGSLCTDLNWYWPNPNGRAGSSPGGTSCILHVTGPFGGLWRSWDGEEWWRMLPSESGLKPGYLFQDDVDRTRRRLGL